MYKFEAIFTETTDVVTLSGLYQWDYGQKLHIKGLSLPPTLEVHFSNKSLKEATVMVATTQGSETVVDIPNKLLEDNKDIIAYIFYTHETQGKTLKRIVLKVEERSKPQDFVSTNPDATTVLGDVVNKVNQNIADNKKFKADITKQQNDFENKINKDHADFKEEVNGLVAGKLINDDVVTKDRTWSSEKISNHPFGNVQGENSVSFESGVDQIIKPKFYGESSQQTTKGYQLFDASKLPTKTQGGATVTNNGDGSFTISGSGNLTANGFYLGYTYTHEETVKLLKSGILRVNTFPDIIPYCEVTLQSNLGNKHLNKGTKELTITDEFLNESSTVLKIIFYGDANSSIKSGTIKPMLYQEGNGAWEPFTGVQPSPNPEYPQPIISKEISSISINTNQLFDASKLPTKTQGGATVTNNGDGSFTISGSGNLTQEFNLNYRLERNELKNLLKVGELTVKGGNHTGMPYFEVDIFANGKHIYHRNGAVNITQEILNASDLSIRFALYGGVGNPIKPTTFKPMIYQEGDGTWEPFKQTLITLSKPITLRGLPSEDGNVIIDGERYISDVICEKDGVVGVERNVGTHMFTTETWNDLANNRFVTNKLSNNYYHANNLEPPLANIMCEYFNQSNEINTSKYVICTNWNGDIIVSSNTIKTDYTAESFKQFMKDKKIVYQLATPTFEPLPQADQDKLKTLLVTGGSANVFANAFIDLNYVSSKNYVLPYDIYSKSEVDSKFGDVEMVIDNILGV